MINIEFINKDFSRIEKGGMAHRFVIDMATLNAE